MSIRLSAVGIKEWTPPKQTSLGGFSIDDEDVADVAGRVDAQPVSVSLLDALREWSRLQRQALDALDKIFANVPAGLSVVSSTDSEPQGDTEAQYPAGLLAKPWENITIDTPELGFPPGIVKLLNQAGVISLVVLYDHVINRTLCNLPRIGKAKGELITDTVDAFWRACQRRQSDE